MIDWGWTFFIAFGFVIASDYGGFEESEIDELTTSTISKATRLPVKWCNSIRFVSREKWQAKPYEHKLPMKLPIDKVFVDYTYGERCSSYAYCTYFLQALQNYHITDIGLFDIAYNFMIGDDGRVYVGRDFNSSRAFDDHFNDNSLLIGLIGDFVDASKILPRAIDLIYKIVRCGQEMGYIQEPLTIFEPIKEKCDFGPGKKLFMYMKWNRKREVHYRCLDEGRAFLPELLRESVKQSVPIASSYMPVNNSFGRQPDTNNLSDLDTVLRIGP